LIIAAPEVDAWSIVKDVLPFLSFSAPFVIYHQYLLVPLATCMHNLQVEKLAIGLQITEPWLREYQLTWVQQTIRGSENADMGTTDKSDASTADGCVSTHGETVVKLKATTKNEDKATECRGSEMLTWVQQTIRCPKMNRSYAPFVALSKRFSKCATTVVCAWPNTFAGHASFLTMIHPRDSFTVMVVVSAESVGRKTSFNVTNVVFDMSKFWEKLDMEIAATPMPEFYQDKLLFNVGILNFKSSLLRRYGSCATTLEPALKCHSILWHISARVASPTTLVKLEAELGFSYPMLRLWHLPDSTICSVFFVNEGLVILFDHVVDSSSMHPGYVVVLYLN
ncbi:tRNA (adenine(58)-N(1))-methyltransferase non-catalytic subunit TRM6, partial [Tanacetum coccineum]